MTKKPKVLIIGASLAGPTLAYWLARAGFEVTLTDISRGLREGGNGVDVREQAVAVVDRMGLLEAVRGRSLRTRGFAFKDLRRSAPVVLDLKREQARAGYEDIEIPRGDLAQLLFEASKDDADYRFGRPIDQLVDRGSAVEVRFADGREEQFDLVVGADGLHSQVRRLVFGPDRDFVSFGGAYFAFGTSATSIGQDGWATFFNRPGKSVAVQRANGADQVHFMFRSNEPLAYDYRDLEAQRRLVRDAFSDTSWYPAPLLGAADAADFYFDSISQVKLPSWHRGRIVLVGDAAWCASPASGAGALLALVGAYRLAGALGAARDDLTAAFARYEAQQRPLVQQKQRGLFLGISVPSSRFGIWLRNRVLASPLAGILSGVAPRNIPQLEPYSP